MTAEVPSSLTIVDVNVTLLIEHSRDADLNVVLRHPDGTGVTLFRGVGALFSVL